MRSWRLWKIIEIVEMVFKTSILVQVKNVPNQIVLVFRKNIFFRIIWSQINMVTVICFVVLAHCVFPAVPC